MPTSGQINSNVTYFNRITTSVIETAINMGPVFEFRSNWNLEVLVFIEGGKLEKPEKNPRSKGRTNNKLNPASTGIEHGSQRWEASAYPLRQPYARLSIKLQPSIRFSAVNVLQRQQSSRRFYDSFLGKRGTS